MSSKQAYRVQKNVAFVIDVGSKDPMMMICNLESDDNGAYKFLGTRTSTWETGEEYLDGFEVQGFKMLSSKKVILTAANRCHLVRIEIQTL